MIEYIRIISVLTKYASHSPLLQSIFGELRHVLWTWCNTWSSMLNRAFLKVKITACFQDHRASSRRLRNSTVAGMKRCGKGSFTNSYSKPSAPKRSTSIQVAKAGDADATDMTFSGSKVGDIWPINARLKGYLTKHPALQNAFKSNGRGTKMNIFVKPQPMSVGGGAGRFSKTESSDKNGSTYSKNHYLLLYIYIDRSYLSWIKVEVYNSITHHIPNWHPWVYTFCFMQSTWWFFPC